MNEEEGFLESKALSDEWSVTEGLQVKFWHTRATTLLTAKLFFAMRATLLLFTSQNPISSLLLGSI